MSWDVEIFVELEVVFQYFCSYWVLLWSHKYYTVLSEFLAPLPLKQLETDLEETVPCGHNFPPTRLDTSKFVSLRVSRR